MKDHRIRKKQKPTLFIIIGVLILTLYSISLLGLLSWAVISSFKSRIDFRANPIGFPEELMFSNYLIAFKEMHTTVKVANGIKSVFIPEMLLNSILFSLGITLVSSIIVPSAAYVCAKYGRYRICKIVYNVVLITIIIPTIGTLGSGLLVAKTLGYYDNIFGIYFTSGTSILTSSFLVYYAVFKGVSWEYAEAAFIDGAGHFKIFFKIMMPLIAPTILALGLTSFISHWNDWQGPMIWLPSMPTIAYGLYTFQFSPVNINSSTPMQLAACSIVILPILIVFLIFKKKMIGAISFGSGLKG